MEGRCLERDEGQVPLLRWPLTRWLWVGVVAAEQEVVVLRGRWTMTTTAMR